MALGPTITLVDALGNPISSVLAPGTNNPFLTSSSLLNGGLTVSSANPLPVAEETVGVQVTGSTTVTAATSGSATLPGVAGKTTYVRGFCVTSQVVVTAVFGVVTLTGTISGTLNFQYNIAVSGGLLFITFGNSGLAASAVNTPIVLNLPTIVGGTASALAIWGVQI